MNTHAIQRRAACARGLAILTAAGLTLGTATAMDAQPHVDTSSSASTLPSFLDVERLPDLQQAWRNRFDAAPAADAVIPSQPAGNAGADAASNSARLRAEELSHRFAFESDVAQQPASATVYSTPPPQTQMPAETASIGAGAAPLQPEAQHVLSPIDLEPIDEPVTSSIATDSDGVDAADDQIARALEETPPPTVSDTVLAPASSAAASALPVRRAANIERPVRKVLPEVVPTTRVLNKKSHTEDTAKATATKRETRAPAAAVAARKAPSAPKQLATTKPTGPVYYFSSGSNSATAPDREILMPNEIKSFGWR